MASSCHAHPGRRGLSGPGKVVGSPSQGSLSQTRITKGVAPASDWPGPPLSQPDRRSGTDAVRARGQIDQTSVEYVLRVVASLHGDQAIILVAVDLPGDLLVALHAREVDVGPALVGNEGIGEPFDPLDKRGLLLGELEVGG